MLNIRPASMPTTSETQTTLYDGPESFRRLRAWIVGAEQLGADRCHPYEEEMDSDVYHHGYTSYMDKEGRGDGEG